MENYNIANTAVQESPMSIELHRLEKALCELTEVSNVLEARLEVVMKKTEPQLEKNPVMATPAQSELGVRVRDRVSEVERIVSRLSAILHRLEI